MVCLEFHQESCQSIKRLKVKEKILLRLYVNFGFFFFKFNFHVTTLTNFHPTNVDNKVSSQ